MPDYRAYCVETVVEDRQGSRGVIERSAWEQHGGVYVEVRWFESLSPNTAKGTVSVERIDNLTIVR